MKFKSLFFLLIFYLVLLLGAWASDLVSNQPAGVSMSANYTIMDSQDYLGIEDGYSESNNYSVFVTPDYDNVEIFNRVKTWNNYK